MSSDSWKRLQSEGTMNLDSGIACLSAREVKRMGIIVGLDEPSAVAAADVLACGAVSVDVDILWVDTCCCTSTLQSAVFSCQLQSSTPLWLHDKDNFLHAVSLRDRENGASGQSATTLSSSSSSISVFVKAYSAVRLLL